MRFAIIYSIALESTTVKPPYNEYEGTVQVVLYIEVLLYGTSLFNENGPLQLCNWHQLSISFTVFDLGFQKPKVTILFDSPHLITNNIMSIRFLTNFIFLQKRTCYVEHPIYNIPKMDQLL